MKAVVASAIDGPEVLSPAEMPEPTPGPGQAAIDVEFAGVNYVEIMQRRGDVSMQAPFVPGYEVSGHVRSLGQGVNGLEVGQPVAAMTAPQGGYAEVAVAPFTQTVPLDGLSRPSRNGGRLPNHRTYRIYDARPHRPLEARNSSLGYLSPSVYEQATMEEIVVA